MCICIHDTVIEHSNVILVIAVFSLDSFTRRSKVTVSYGAAMVGMENLAQEHFSSGDVFTNLGLKLYL